MVAGLNLKKLFILMATTSLLGGISILTTAVGLSYEGIQGKTWGDIIAVGIWLFFIGVLFSIISQMGYFAYLSIHRFGLSIFKSVKLWNRVQIVLIAFTFFDLVYLRYFAFHQEGQSILPYIGLPIVLFLASLIGAYIKAKETQQFTFIPALFFLFVITTIEILPVLTQDDTNWVILMLVPTFLCNVWQLLLLHRLLNSGKEKNA